MSKRLPHKSQEPPELTYLPIYDIHQAAFLEFKGTPPILTRQGTRVVFEVPSTPRTYELLRGYQANPLIPLLDFVAVLRRLRARMLEARDGNDRRKEVTDHGQQAF